MTHNRMHTINTIELLIGTVIVNTLKSFTYEINNIDIL